MTYHCPSCELYFKEHRQDLAEALETLHKNTAVSTLSHRVEEKSE